jgi:hypothetical protein
MTKQEYLFETQKIDWEIKKKETEFRQMDHVRVAVRADYIKDNYKYWKATRVRISYPGYISIQKKKEVVLEAHEIDVFTNHYELDRNSDIINLWSIILPNGQRGPKYEIENRPHIITIIE